MNKKDAEPLASPPRLSRSAAERMLEMLSAVDRHGNFIFSATGAVYAARRNGDLVELGTAGEIILACKEAIGGFEGGV